MVISEALREQIQLELEKYPAPRGALLPVLHLVQTEKGYISSETAVEVAEIFGLRAVEIHEVVSFYNMFYDSPQGQHHVYVCTNLPCSLRGGRDLLKGLESRLGIRVGETTSDGRITLGHEECLGACAYAPMMRVDEKYYEDLDVEKAMLILKGLE